MRQLLSAFLKSKKLTQYIFLLNTFDFSEYQYFLSLCENNINVPYQVSFRRPSKASDFVSWQHDMTKGSEAPGDVEELALK